MAETTDVSTGLKPEFVVVVDKIYRDMCNLQLGTKVLIIANSRTPKHVVSLFMVPVRSSQQVFTIRKDRQDMTERLSF